MKELASDGLNELGQYLAVKIFRPSKVDINPNNEILLDEPMIFEIFEKNEL